MDHFIGMHEKWREKIDAAPCDKRAVSTESFTRSADDFAAAMAGTDWTGAEDKDQEEDPEAERERLISILQAAGKRVHPNTGLAKLRAKVAKLQGGN